MNRRTLGSIGLATAILALAVGLILTHERWAYEPYSAEDYGGSYELTLEKRWRLLPGPRFVGRSIEHERFEELAETAQGSEISTGRVLFFLDEDGRVSTNLFLQRRLFLSERALAEESDGIDSDEANLSEGTEAAE